MEENTIDLKDTEGRFSQLSMWKLKSKFISQQNDPPMAKRNSSGSLITSPHLLKELYLETYRERLKRREIKPELRDLSDFKLELWKFVLEDMNRNKTKDWTESD